MINCNPLKVRARDGKQVYTRFSTCYLEVATGKIVGERPEGAAETAYPSYGTGPKLRKDQTGEMYETAHDVEDSPNTYTEMIPNPDEITEFINGGTYVRASIDVYPTWKTATAYNEGDRVTYSGRTYESDFDGNQGNQPNIYGWTEILPYVEKKDVKYKPLSECYPE